MNPLVNYPELVACITAWLFSSALKIPVYYLMHRKFRISLAFGTGGMPSSHAATMTGTTLAIGLFSGFHDPAFAIAMAISMIVIYDAAGVRREAGYHAEALNKMIDEFFQGSTIDQKKLKEMLGHTPMEVLGGILTGLISTLVLWVFWPK
ncbi:MAG: divergent PAP2 family protein [Chloroflexi bacterium]|nr:divergent PAP2 family protein [Chloroflexota bacterium]